MRLVTTGSTPLRLPPWLENQAEFGVPSDSTGQPDVLARALGLFATTSKLKLKTTWAGLMTPKGRCWLSYCRTLRAMISSSWIAAFPRCGYLPCCNSADCPFSPAGRRQPMAGGGAISAVRPG
ncbi:MAG: hypothetical protein L0Y38_11240 [Methylococcaceae bacterium]|nr:hypothetical protein [Methylococcaceae bacterium]MCI0734377.1 hypothetical protein [Methylococcaceae bacterium]